jgi:chemotaxis regulatin CheY-phosphate phosphatase CheZ
MITMYDTEHQNQPSDGAGAESENTGLFRDLIDALSGVIPVLDRIKDTIEESTGKIPGVSSQLHSVTKATESATVEILNTLDVMTRHIDQAEKDLGVLAEAHQQQRSSFQSIVALLEGSSDPAAAKAVEVARQYVEAGTRAADADGALSAVRASLTSGKDRSIDIAMALQVQDITTQQIAGVTHMIESVRTQLGRLFAQMSETDSKNKPPLGPDPDVTGEPPKHFDTNARYAPTADRQGGADEIVEQFNKPRHE